MDRKEAIEIIQKNWPYGRHQLSEALQTLIPEFQESEEEKIKKWIRKELESKYVVDNIVNNVMADKALAWLEKQGEPRVDMIQWKGDNLREVLEFTGKNKNFDKWFASFEKFEEYVHEHNDIFKIFNDDDGSHCEVPVGAWIIKTPDGYNVASKAKYKQKIEQISAWSEEDEKKITGILMVLESWDSYHVSSAGLPSLIPDYVSWLKSLKERYTWKPSKEQ